MSHVETALMNAVAVSRHLAEADPQDEAVARTCKNLQDQVSLLKDLARSDRGWGKESMEDDAEFIGKQVQKLKSAAAVPARNYARIMGICDGLTEAVTASRRPENAAVRPKLAAVIKKVAGIFSEVDTVQDLDKDLATIEKAVHSLYNNGKMNDPATYYFEARGKGHHEKK